MRLSLYSAVLTGTGVPGPQGQKGDPGSFVPNSGYSKTASFLERFQPTPTNQLRFNHDGIWL